MAPNEFWFYVFKNILFLKRKKQSKHIRLKQPRAVAAWTQVCPTQPGRASAKGRTISINQSAPPERAKININRGFIPTEG